ncbi:MAG: carboxysome shell protein [Gammaproteobacteria bacterium]|nr:carboxysome shell protein [Gammaproteobacteria bacterium]
MAQTANNNMTARAASLARRRAMSQTGKAAIANTQAASRPARASSSATGSATAPAPRASGQDARSASRARRIAMSQAGKAGLTTTDRTRSAPAKTATSTPAPQAAKVEAAPAPADNGQASTAPQVEVSTSRQSRNVVKRKVMQESTARAASRARRVAMSQRGKAGIDSKGMSSAQTTRAANPHLSSRELAKAVRDKRCKTGGAGQKKSQPVGRVRPGKAQQGGAQDAPWKVGVSETTQGQTLTGTMVGRSDQVTGDEPSTCRDVTGTEYLGADIFRQFCSTDPAKPARKVGMSATTHGNSVTGNRLGRSGTVTGNEPGSCKNVTGDEYVGAEQTESFCGSKSAPSPSKITSSQTRKGKDVTGDNVGRSKRVTGDEGGASRELTGTQYMQRGNGNAPAKVGASNTLRGGSMTGTMVGRSERVTGDEPGSCKNVTGDDYVGQEQYQGFCAKTPAPTDRKVGVSQTLKGEGVTGTQTGRSGKVTGDESGTCKAVSGTPYAGAEQYEGYCRTEDTTMAMARARRPQQNVGAAMTGIQPGLGGKATGDSKGACESLTGTPYVGADQYSQVCPSTPADTSSPDFPQPLSGGAAWGDFSVTSPVHASQSQEVHSAVTGSSYEKGQITGPFGMAGGKVTGTEEARFGHGRGQVVTPSAPPQAEMVEGRLKSRVTGEGMEAGLKITGDDWDRGDSVTGTEGTSAVRRNPTRRGNGGSVMSERVEPKRNEELPVPNSKVTGGSGNTEKGAFVTYSGGARG